MGEFIGYHYDIARGAYLKLETFKSAIRLAASSGFTHFLPYLENMIRLPAMERACPENAYTADEWKELENTAISAGIELVPHFNVIGHTETSCWPYTELCHRKGEYKLDITSEAVRSWTLRCVKQFCAISKARYFLIGGDEWQAPEELLIRSDFDGATLWAEHVNRSVEFLASQGRIPIVWHDMLVHYPSAMSKLSRKATIAYWWYDEDSDYPLLSWLKEEGFNVIMASGICHGLLTNRRVRALEMAKRTAEHHKVAGFMVTSWEDGRWEKQRMNITLIGRWLRHASWPEPIIRSLSLAECLSRIPSKIPLSIKWQKQLGGLLENEAWQEFPECRSHLMSMLRGTQQQDLTWYEKYQHPAGPLYEQIKRQEARTFTPFPVSSSISAVPTKQFGLTIEDRVPEGPTLRFWNKDETFVIYPKFGGTLQDWCVNDITVIPHTLPPFAKQRHDPPGGFMSYAAAYGFRPILALGTSYNPCIFWSHPATWSIIEESEDGVLIELKQELYCAALTYRIGIVRGVTGFSYEARVKNKLKKASCALHWNLLLAFKPDDVETTCFQWEDATGERAIRIGDQSDSGFFLPAHADFTVTTKSWNLRIGGDPKETAGYFVDWSSTWLTPDLRGKYRTLLEGDEMLARWHFSAGKLM